jgi:hypothetical protein
MRSSPQALVTELHKYLRQPLPFPDDRAGVGSAVGGYIVFLVGAGVDDLVGRFSRSFGGFGVGASSSVLGSLVFKSGESVSK